MHTHTKEALVELSPDKALNYLKEGNERFVNNKKANVDLLHQVKEGSTGQHPFAAILSCMDSRTSVELIFDQGIGDVFSIRIAGNIANEDIIGSLEYATKVVGSKLILVLGHTKCGAITGACDSVELGNITQLLHKVKPAIEKESETTNDRNGKNAQFVRNVTDLNVKVTIEKIMQDSPIIAELVKEGSVKIAGGVYDVETGRVNFFD